MRYLTRGGLVIAGERRTQWDRWQKTKHCQVDKACNRLQHLGRLIVFSGFLYSTFHDTSPLPAPLTYRDSCGNRACDEGGRVREVEAEREGRGVLPRGREALLQL